MASSESKRSEHADLLAAIGSALGESGPYVESPIPRTPGAPPGLTVLAGAVDPGSGRVAWVEDTVDSRDERGYFLGCEVMAHVAGGGLGHHRIRLRHYNPYFGTDVHLIRWIDDSVIVVYTEKHRTYAVRINSQWERVSTTIEVGRKAAMDLPNGLDVIVKRLDGQAAGQGSGA